MKKTEYVITDPCYILPQHMWEEACKVLDDTNSSLQNFNNKVTELLNSYAETKDAVACRTGYGDWTNSFSKKDDEEDQIKYQDFCADSGMVCVVEYTENIKKTFDKENFKRGCAALIETHGDVSIYLNREDLTWTRVEITDENNRFISI